MYFRLLPHIFLVKGKSNSIIQDVLLQEILVVDSDLADLIAECEQNKPFDDKYREHIDELVRLNLGKVTSKPIFVDKLRLQNARFDLFESKFSSYNAAVLQITNACGKKCEVCGHVFCPMCVHRDDIHDTLGLAEWKKVIDKLELLGCKSFVLTGGDVTLCSYFCDIVEYILGKSLNVTVLLNGNAPKLQFNKSVKIKIFVLSPADLNEILQRYKEFDDVTLYCYFKRKSIDVPENFKISFCSDVIREEDISCSDLATFHNRLHSSQCKKITVMSNGDVYPCLGAVSNNENCVGNIHDVPLGKLANDIKERFWGFTVNMLKKCQDCEYRYTCDSCAFFDATKNCKYNVDKGEWVD